MQALFQHLVLLCWPPISTFKAEEEGEEEEEEEEEEGEEENLWLLELRPCRAEAKNLVL